MTVKTNLERDSKARRATFAVAIVAIIALLGVGSAVSGGFSRSWSDKEQGRPISEYAKNQSGETYGSLSKAETDIDAPELISAVGTNGVSGYIRRGDFVRPLPQSPEQALAEQATRPLWRTMPLYEKDGQTVIGEYRSGGEVRPIERSVP